MTITENIQNTSISAGSLTVWVQSLNDWIIATFPNAGPDFKIEDEAIGWMVGVFSISSVSSIVGSVATFIKDFGIGIFSVCFISFFLIKDEMLLKKIIGSISPDKIEEKVIATIGDIEGLLSRYFLGLIGEILAVALINFLGLFLVARLGFSAAIGIAFMTGILNIIPYVGPLIGVVTGASLGLALKLSTAAAAGGDINAIAILLILIACLFFTQLVDNFVLQPVIYSTSIKSNPLEIFIVLLLAGTLGGIVGMLVAIPAYTVIRVIAASFYPEVKFIKRLIQ
jgi:predicted PurR-regulated permease PerM